jgi:hypothetical protein
MFRSHMILVVALAVTPASSAPERVLAEVVLSVPGCDLFVVKTADGFTVIRKREHWAVFEGDQVRGTLQVTGNSELEILGEMSVAVTVEGWGMDLKASKRPFYHACIPDRERFLDLPDLTVHHRQGR